MSLELAAPFYMGLSCLLSMCYTCMQSVKHKGKLTSDTQMYLICWVICASLVTSAVFGATTLASTPASYSNNYAMMFMVVTLILVCVTLITSAFMVYWTI